MDIGKVLKLPAGEEEGDGIGAGEGDACGGGVAMLELEPPANGDIGPGFAPVVGMTLRPPAEAGDGEAAIGLTGIVGC